MTIVLVALLSTLAWGAEPNVEFCGVLTSDGKTKVALTNKATGITRWVDPGAEFLGYVVARYDSRSESVTLHRAGQDFRLPLVAAKETTGAPSGPGGTPAGPGAPTGAVLRGNTPGASVTRVPPPSPPPPAPAAVLAPEPPAPTGAVPAGAPTGATGAVLAGASTAATGAVPASAPTGATGEATAVRSVQAGETLDSIARSAGLTPEQLRALNPNVNAGSLQVGQPIRIR